MLITGWTKDSNLRYKEIIKDLILSCFNKIPVHTLTIYTICETTFYVTTLEKDP